MTVPYSGPNKGLMEQLIDRAREVASTTPGKLQIWLGAIFVCSLLFCSVVAHQIGEVQKLVKTVGKDSAPSIIAAEQIRAGLCDMEANAANGFFSQGAAAAKKQYDKDREQVAFSLVEAAQNITYGDEEKTPIRALNNGIGSYIELTEDARRAGSAKGLQLLNASKAQMNEQLIASAAKLDDVNYSHLNKEYGSGVGGRKAPILLGGILLIVLSVLMQVQLFWKFRRIINPPLLIGSIALIGFVLFSLHAVDASGEHLRIAKSDAFDSVHALWQAKAIAFQANAEESFYLLEPDKRTESQTNFKNLSEQLSNGYDFDAIKNSPGDKDSTQAPLFTKQVKNITFTSQNEEGLTRELLIEYGKYKKIDEEIRALEISGKHQEAVMLCTGTAPGQSNYAFDSFNSKLDSLIELNMKQFSDNIAKADADLAPVALVGYGVGLLVAILAIVGLAPRIKEYA